MRFLVFFLLLMVSSCLVLGAPHRHKYKAFAIAVDESMIHGELIVFCTRGKKKFVFTSMENFNFEICSKVIPENCEKMNKKTIYGQNEYVSKDVKMSEREFNKLFSNDTLIIKNRSLNKEYKFIPVIGSR